MRTVLGRSSATLRVGSARPFSRTASKKQDANELLATPLASKDTFLQHLAHYPQTERSTLDNGVRVATEATDGESATVGVWIDAGSRYENDENNGVAHFAEHMIFKGTSKRSRQTLEKEVENMGGHLNAYTSREQTVFYTKVVKDKVPQAMELLSDILLKSEFQEAAVESERDVILREHQEVQGELQEVCFDLLHETAYRGTPLGKTILGSPEQIQTLTRDQIVNYVKSMWTGPRMVVAAAGAVDHKQIADLTQKHFGDVPVNPPGGEPIVPAPAFFTGSEIRMREDDVDMAHVALAYPTFGWNDPDSTVLMVMQTMLGSYDKYAQGEAKYAVPKLSSKLARDNYGTKLMPFSTMYSDTGLFGVYHVGYPMGQHRLFRTIMMELSRFSHEVDPDLLNYAKNKLMMSVLTHNLDGSTQVCEDIGRQMLTYGRRLHPMETYSRIQTVDADAIKAVARRVLYDRDHALAAYGNIYEVPDPIMIRKHSYWSTQ